MYNGGRFVHDATMKLQNWPRPSEELIFPPSATHFAFKKFNMSRSGYLPKFHQIYGTCHQILHLPRQVPFQHQMVRLKQKSEIATSPHVAPATRSDTPTSPMVRLPRKVTLQNGTCLEKWRSTLAWHIPTSPNGGHKKWDASDVWCVMWVMCGYSLLWASLLWATQFSELLYSELLCPALLYSELLCSDLLGAS